MFPVKAVFWTLVVAAFVPKDFSAPDDGAFAQEAAIIAAQFDADRAAGDLEAAAEDVCAGRETTCEIVGEAGDIARLIVDLAAANVTSLMDSRAADDAGEAIDQVFVEASADRPAR